MYYRRIEHILQVFENETLRKIFDPKKDDVSGQTWNWRVIA
jgi:hypothetical protein